MIIVSGTISIDPSSRDEMLEAVAPMVESTLAEPGCHDYVFSADPTNPSQVRLYELWESEAALSSHFDTEHMARWQARSAKLPIVDRKILKYTISEVGPVR